MAGVRGQGLRSRLEAKVNTGVRVWTGFFFWLSQGSRTWGPHRQCVQLARAPSSSSSSPGVSAIEAVSLAGRLAVGRVGTEVST